jgi:omega-amidase
MTLVRVGLCSDHRLLFSPRHAKRLAALDILLFPELLDGGYAALKHGARPHRAGDPFITDFVTASMTIPACIIAGSTFFEDASRLRTNTCFVYQDGHLLHRYDKIHLFKPGGDHRYFVPGTRIRPFVMNAGRMRLRAGAVICYDLRFPELTRSLAQQGIRILFVPARWPLRRDDAWRTLLKARAIENQIFVIGCNAPGPEGGYSYAFDPLGRMIYSSQRSTGRKLVRFVLDLDAIAEAHAMHQNIEDALLLKERAPLRLLKLPKVRRAHTSTRRSRGR